MFSHHRERHRVIRKRQLPPDGFFQFVEMLVSWILDCNTSVRKLGRRNIRKFCEKIWDWFLQYVGLPVVAIKWTKGYRLWSKNVVQALYCKMIAKVGKPDPPTASRHHKGDAAESDRNLLCKEINFASVMHLQSSNLQAKAYRWNGQKD